jgi:NTP pyrophosphatase (non-canonical NTP hydrolase)
MNGSNIETSYERRSTVTTVTEIPTTMNDVLTDVFAERRRQTQAWGGSKGDCAQPTTPDTRRLGILVEEVGEVAELVNNDGIISDRPRLDVLIPMYRELIQVAAVAIAWCEGLSAELECADAKERLTE